MSVIILNLFFDNFVVKNVINGFINQETEAEVVEHDPFEEGLTKE